MVPPQERCPELGKRNLVVMSGKMGAMDDALAPIEPLSVQEVVSVLRPVNSEPIDVSILRRDQEIASRIAGRMGFARVLTRRWNSAALGSATSFSFRFTNLGTGRPRSARGTRDHARRGPRRRLGVPKRSAGSPPYRYPWDRQIDNLSPETIVEGVSPGARNPAGCHRNRFPS